MPPTDLMSISGQEWDAVMDSNLKSVWLCCQQGGLMMPQDSLIINISDTGASKTWMKYGAYVISKAGAETLTRILARQLAPKIRVNAIAPGLLMKDEDMPDDAWNKLVVKSPLQRETNLEELLSVIDLLIKNRYITGEILHLDGGSHLQ